MVNFRTLALTALITGLVIAPAYADFNSNKNLLHNGNKRSQQVERLKQLLELTPQQEVEFSKIQKARRQNAALLQQELKQNREAIREVLDAESLNEQRLRELTREQADRRADRMVAKHATRVRINQLLTPEQQKKHEEFRQQRRMKKAQHRGKERRAGETTH